MKTEARYSPEVRERAVGMVLDLQNQHESQWAAIVSIAAKIGCTAETLRRWVRPSERYHGTRAQTLIKTDGYIGNLWKMASQNLFFSMQITTYCVIKVGRSP